jgi:hypothetical protein
MNGLASKGWRRRRRRRGMGPNIWGNATDMEEKLMRMKWGCRQADGELRGEGNCFFFVGGQK